MARHDPAGLVAKAEAFNTSHPLVRRGVDVVPVCFGIAFTARPLNQAEALVHVYADGTVSVTTGAVEMGQGVSAKIQAAAVHELGVAAELVHVEPTTTSRVANVSPTAASTGADLKGLMKAAYHDPNPVVMLEHKGLYWSKIKGTEDAKTIEPSADYVIPFGKARIVQEASADQLDKGKAAVIITYGMGVYWAKAAAKDFPGRVTIVDLRTLAPLDEDTVMAQVQRHGRCLVVTEEQITNSFAQALAGRIGNICFQYLDAPVRTIGAADMPAIPLNSTLEGTMIPSAEKVGVVLKELLDY